MDLEELEFVADVSTWNSGGGLELDIVTLKDGRVLAISDEAVVLYENIEDLIGGDAVERPMLPL